MYIAEGAYFRKNLDNFVILKALLLTKNSHLIRFHYSTLINHEDRKISAKLTRKLLNYERLLRRFRLFLVPFAEHGEFSIIDGHFYIGI